MSDNQPVKLPRGQMLTIGGAGAVAALLSSFAQEGDALTPMGLDLSGEATHNHNKGTKFRGVTLDFQVAGAANVLITDDFTKFLGANPPDIVYAMENGKFCGVDGDLEYAHHHTKTFIYIGVWSRQTRPIPCPTATP